MNDDSDHSLDSRRLSSSLTQGGLFGSSPKDSFNVSRWFNNIIKTKPQDIPQIDEFNVYNSVRRPRTQSVSSDISVDDQPMSERRSSFSDRFFAMQMQQPKSAEKFNNFRSAVTSYYD